METLSQKSNKRTKRKFKEFSKPKLKSNQSLVRKHDSKGSIQSEKISSLEFEDDAPDFPRGGRNLLSRKEEEEIRAEVDAEFAQEQRQLTKKRRQKKNSGVEDDLGSLFGDGITGKLPRFANRITLKNIACGMKIWGVIVEVNSKDIVVSLPGGLRGYVRTEEASDCFADELNDLGNIDLCNLFHIGELVPCTVTQVADEKKDGKGFRRILLSLRLSLLQKGLTLETVQAGMVITAVIKSIEDHGYILHFGSSSFSGFLPKDEADATGVKFIAGQLLQGVVKTIDVTRRVIYLNYNPTTASKCVTKDIKGMSIELLVPGMLVNARVLSAMENGIMLSFLTFFTGTVDIFHLQTPFPNSDWKKDYNENKKVVARILFIDTSTRAIGLTLNPHLICNSTPPIDIRIGDIYDTSRVVRVDRRGGLLLEIPSTPAPVPAYVTVADVADEVVKKIEKKFKEGSQVRVRVLSYKHLEGLIVGSLKASAFEGSVISHSDVKPGMLIKAKVIHVENYGAIVQFAGGVKALCPLPHMSELDISKPPKKFQVGSEFLFRVLGCKSKRITVTSKKTMVKSKLPVLTSYGDATSGLVTHGWISKIEKHGCFVKFYSGVHGFAPRSQLCMEAGSEADTMYHVGQVVKCRVTTAIPSSRRINLSFSISSKRGPMDDKPAIGNLISGVIERVTSHAVVVKVNSNGDIQGTILDEHLADFHGHAVLMKSLLKPGYKFDELLVLDVEGENLILSAKYSLINCSKQIPFDIQQVHPHSVVHGYICNIIDSGCFVRFLGQLTGFSPKNKAVENLEVNLSESFYIGQSVRSYIVNIDCEKRRMTLSLRPSASSSVDASFIQGYFLLDEKISQLQLSETNLLDMNLMQNFAIGNLVEGVVQEEKEFGFIVNFKEHSDVLGFIASSQKGGAKLEVGTVVNAVVLDFSKVDSLVDLSLKEELVRTVERGLNITSKKKRQREAFEDIDLHRKVTAIVEMVKENYLVLSIPECNYAIGYASRSDYNTQKFAGGQFSVGQTVIVTIEALPSPSTTGKLLLVLKSLSDLSDSSSLKRAKKKGSYKVGSKVEAEIIEIKPLELRVKFGVGFYGRLHITEVTDDNQFMEKPFDNYKIGQFVTARILAEAENLGKRKSGYLWELSVKPSLVSEAGSLKEGIISNGFDYSIGGNVNGYVIKVDNEWIWLSLSREVKAQVFILDSSFEPNELQDFQNRFSVGQLVSGSILSINKEKKLLRLTLRTSTFQRVLPSSDSSKVDNGGPNLEEKGWHIHEGDIIGGRISKVLPVVGGLTVQIGPNLYGRVHFTELTDSFVPDPLSGFKEGQFVKCRVIEISRSFKDTARIDLSIRVKFDNDVNSYHKRLERFEELHPGMSIQGYVKNISSKGCFIMLSRKIDARILFSNLSDGFVEKPEVEFPLGKLINGKILSVEPLSKRVDVTLRMDTSKNLVQIKNDFHNLSIGSIIGGTIRRVEPYGLFVTIEDTNMVGLCHISEISDSRVENIESKYHAGEHVVAKILKVDKERQRISLGMKNSYISETANLHVTNVSSNISFENNIRDAQQSTPDEGKGTAIHDTHNLFTKQNDLTLLDLAQTTSRSSVLPLEVPLDDVDSYDVDNTTSGTLDQLDENIQSCTNNESGNRRAKKKKKEERELEIQAAEERLLEKDIPRTVDEFERMVRSSPNSSFIWLKYMSFMLSMAEIEKARAIAERALNTINFREEAEKLNIWVAYFNLENECGNPKEEAVMKIFQRALQYNDPKKIHMALMGLYERTEQYKLAEELLEKMVRSFRNSCKVWLKHVVIYLSQRKDPQPITNRALLSLPQKKHIKFLSHVAIAEFKHGSIDRGRSMFEGILRDHPKRTDLWSIYLDQEIRVDDSEIIRALFERATSISLPPKKMKFLFKKYLEYEKSSNNEERVEYVKNRAIEYVESTLG